MAAHAKTCYEGGLSLQVVSLFHLRIELFIHKGPVLHLGRVYVVQIPAVVEAIGSNDAEACAVAYLLQVIFCAPIAPVSAPAVEQKEGRGLGRCRLRRKDKNCVVAFKVWGIDDNLLLCSTL